MDREIPVINRLISKKQCQRRNDIMVDKIMNMKFANFSLILDKSKQNTKSIDRSNKLHTIKLSPVDRSRKKRVVTVLDTQYKIKQENKMLYQRLINQKGMISNKIFAQDRQKNIEYLKRIGRYPYQRIKTQHVVIDDEQQNKIHNSQSFNSLIRSQRHTNHQISYTNLSQSQNYSSSDQEHQRLHHIKSKISQQQNKAHRIILYSKVHRLKNKWYTIKFIRLKSQYQILVTTFPTVKTQYSLRLAQQIATQLLSQNDYDYVFIIKNCFKVNQHIFFVFTLNSNLNKRLFYKFNQRYIMGVVEEEEENGKETQKSQKIEDQDSLLFKHLNYEKKNLFPLENLKNGNQVVQKFTKKYRFKKSDENEPQIIKTKATKI